VPWAVWLSDIAVPPSTVRTVRGDFTLGPLAILTARGHMHARGTALRATVGGERWYEARDWRHPPLLRNVQPEAVPAKTPLVLECDYDNGVRRPVRRCNGEPCELRAGPLADDAMCVLSGYALEGP
jgi:hypothetical protein